MIIKTNQRKATSNFGVRNPQLALEWNRTLHDPASPLAPHHCPPK